MSLNIKFGTDGWRGIMAADFTFANLRRVSAAVAKYIQEQGAAQQGLVIGRDTRFLAEEFADTVAQCMTSYGIPVYLIEGASPTPVTAHAILQKQAAGAVMLTASHNPPQYNGFKFIPHYAGPATPQITNRIVELIRGEEEEAAANRDLITPFDPKPAYLKFLAKQVDFSIIARAQLKPVINPMYGAGIGILEEVFTSLNLEYAVQNNWRDPLYGGTMPEPKPELLGDLSQAVLAGEGNIGLALDGDADRFGVIDSTGHYLLPNELLCLLASYLLEVKGVRGPIARTVTTTTLLDRIAAHYQCPIIETPVGFKYQGQAMMEQGAILAGEESGGLSILGHIPEKDGILACLLAAEMTAHFNKPLSQVYQELTQRFGAVFTRRLDFHCTNQEKEAILAKLRDFDPRAIAGVAVTEILTLDGWKYVLADGSWLLVRASGTEAVFRLYGEAGSLEELNRIQGALADTLGL